MLLKATAKINIGLRIIEKRDDGFHNIETIFYPVKLFDEIDFNISPAKKDFNSVIIKSEKFTVPANKTNTCVKAVESFFKEFKIKDCFLIDIKLKKNIPVGGGMGGGSSDAGAIFRYLINYFGIDIDSSRNRILRAALSVGSDVPFFIIQKPCYATGRGENLKILNSFNLNYHILIVNPNLHVSTKIAYEALNFPKGLKKDYILNNIETFIPEKKELFLNEFEEPVFKIYPKLAEVKRMLIEAGAVFASLSGSGAVLYGLFRKSDRDKVFKTKSKFEKKGYYSKLV